MLKLDTISYLLQRSHRKTLAIKITREGVLVYAPYRISRAEIDRFVQSKRKWIEKKLDAQACRPKLPVLSEAEQRALRCQAKQVLSEKTALFAKQLGVSYSQIRIRSQRTRWGSCSGKGNLNFNCLLMLTPEPVQDYVVVHELCHLREMNHSASFWSLVESVLPDYRLHKQWLKENGTALIERLPE